MNTRTNLWRNPVDDNGDEEHRGEQADRTSGCIVEEDVTDEKRREKEEQDGRTEDKHTQRVHF